MAFEIIRNDITKVSADAIVNTANPDVAVGFGVDKAIYDAAGKDRLLEERAKIGFMFPGDAAYTPAFDLDAKYIIHTVGPVWEGGSAGEKEILAQCYRKALAIAKDLDCESVAFPLMSAGTYGFPKDAALKTAISEISDFLFGNEMDVYLVVYDKESFEVSGKAFNDIRSFIEEEDVVLPPSEEARRRRRFAAIREANILERPRRRGARELFKTSKTEGLPKIEGEGRDDAEETPILFNAEAEVAERWDFLPGANVVEEPPIVSADMAESEEAEEEWDFLPEEFETDKPVMAGAGMAESIVGDQMADVEYGANIDDWLDHRESTFQEHLFRIIDRKGLDDKDVYKKANINRKHFSKIKSNVNYNPSKKTAVAFAIALDLNLDETKDLLLKAGLALTRSSRFDLIIEYCITNNIRDIYEINCILFEYDQPLLGY